MSSRSESARLGHIKRNLAAGEPLKGKTLKLALEILDVDYDNSKFGLFMKGIREKIKSGETLGEYEYHYFVETILQNMKLDP